MDLETLIEETRKAELEYAPIPPSGRGTGKRIIRLKDILPKLKPFSVRKPVAFIVGSLATHGQSDNDIDIVVRGEDWSPQQKMAFDFRIYRMFSDILGVPYDEVAKYVHIHYTNSGPFTPYVPIYEDTMMPISNPSIVQMGEAESIHMFGPFKVVDKSKKRVIAGYASVVEIDKSGDVIPISALKEGIKTLLSDPAYANIMLTHNNIQIGKILPEYNGIKTHVDDKGLFIVAEIRDDLEIANKVWEKILAGEYNGFSIAGEIIRSHQECDEEKCYNIIDKINIFEVSVCKNPVNEKSGFIILSKCDACENIGESMEEELVVDSTEEVTEETKSEELKLEALERRVEALEKVIQELANKQDEEEEEEEEAEETEEKGGLVGAIAAVLKEIYQDVPKKIQEKLDTVLTMLENLRRGGYPYPFPSTYPYPSKYPYPEKAEWHEMVTEALDKFYEEIESLKCIKKELEELKIAAKAKDDAIKSLEEQIKQASEKKEEEKKTEEEPKEPETVVVKEDDEIAEESPVIIKGDEITLNVD